MQGCRQAKVDFWWEVGRQGGKQARVQTGEGRLRVGLRKHEGVILVNGAVTPVTVELRVVVGRGGGLTLGRTTRHGGVILLETAPAARGVAVVCVDLLVG